MLKNSGKRFLGHLALLTTMAILALASITALSQAGSGNAAQQGTVVVLVPPDQAYVGEITTLRLVVNNASNLAGFQSRIKFDPTSLRFAGANIEADLDDSGRGVLPMGPVQGEGMVALGATTCPVEDCSSSPQVSSARQNQGVGGSVELATVDFLAEAPGQYEFILEDVRLVDPQGNPLTAGTTHASVEIVVP